jgi:hypothetical protein
VRTDSYVIGVKVAQRDSGGDRDVLSAGEIGQLLVQRLFESGMARGLLVEAEIIVGDNRTEQPSDPVGVAEIEDRIANVVAFRPSRTPSLDRLVARGHY